MKSAPTSSMNQVACPGVDATTASVLLNKAYEAHMVEIQRDKTATSRNFGIILSILSHEGNVVLRQQST